MRASLGGRPLATGARPAQETNISAVADPLGGSYYIEALTAGLAEEARRIIAEVDEIGGMARAVDAGMPKARIEAAAARKQARIDSGRDAIVGVNKFRPRDGAEGARGPDARVIDNARVRRRAASPRPCPRDGHVKAGARQPRWSSGMDPAPLLCTPSGLALL
mmetsp:Transcript_15962/g.48751  ORF Transcript_15962/g.48751 Transcript_15962/m.48751 type:complete len:163 (+) Transcript_15962:1420-1908(+)